MKTILIVEDDRQISRIIELQLHHAGFNTLKAYDGLEAQQVFYAHSEAIDLVLLDVMLPIKDGFAVLLAIRKKEPTQPIIFLTAKDATEDVVRGLNNGANDYIKKPFDFEELLARINANIRKKADGSKEDSLTYVDLTMDLTDFTVRRSDLEIHLSRTEFDLLYYLMLNHHLVQTREQILNHVWGYDYDGNENIIDVYIKYLRDKIDKPFERKLIQTVRGRGYVIK
ncbi:response regulator transcription factor [Eubacterium sp.]|uniref:response regulator transcription factor n=1 Tax=Eubacterium sp. TaxID=142586 RepID=UPI002FCC766D